jgi:hypothetical protein
VLFATPQHIQRQLQHAFGAVALACSRSCCCCIRVYCSWLAQQPVFYNMQLLLRGLPKPSLMDVQLAAVTSPLLRLRVLQLKLWKVRPCCPSLKHSCTMQSSAVHEPHEHAGRCSRSGV